MLSKNKPLKTIFYSSISTNSILSIYSILSYSILILYSKCPYLVILLILALPVTSYRAKHDLDYYITEVCSC